MRCMRQGERQKVVVVGVFACAAQIRDHQQNIPVADKYECYSRIRDRIELSWCSNAALSAFHTVCRVGIGPPLASIPPTT